MAFALDTLDAIGRCRYVHDLVVVSPHVGYSQLIDGCTFVQARAGSPLNDAVDQAVEQTRCPSDQMIAVIAGDLPTLQPEELDEVLAAAGRKKDTVHTADLGGCHATMHVERASTFQSCLAPDPTRRHRPRGVEVGQRLPGLRCDVDTPEGLRIASHLGLGPATREAMRRWGRGLGAQVEPL